MENGVQSGLISITALGISGIILATYNTMIAPYVWRTVDDSHVEYNPELKRSEKFVIQQRRNPKSGLLEQKEFAFNRLKPLGRIFTRRTVQTPTTIKINH